MLAHAFNEPIHQQRAGGRLAIRIVLPPVILDVHEVSGEVRIGLFVANNPINYVDPLGLFSCAELKALIANLTQQYQASIGSAADAQNALTQIANADRAQGALLWSSTVLSTGGLALGGAPAIGFAGFGSSAAVVGRGTFTLVVSTSAGEQVIATGEGSTVGSTALTSSGVSGSLAAGRFAEHFLDPRFNSRAQAATEQLNSALAAEQSLLAALRDAYQALGSCGCK